MKRFLIGGATALVVLPLLLAQSVAHPPEEEGLEPLVFSDTDYEPEEEVWPPIPFADGPFETPLADMEPEAPPELAIDLQQSEVTEMLRELVIIEEMSKSPLEAEPLVDEPLVDEPAPAEALPELMLEEPLLTRAEPVHIEIKSGDETVIDVTLPPVEPTKSREGYLDRADVVQGRLDDIARELGIEVPEEEPPEEPEEE